MKRCQNSAKKLINIEKLITIKYNNVTDYNTLLKKTASCENELSSDRTRNALEPEDFLVSLGRQENRRFFDTETLPLKRMQSKFEGKFPVPKLLGTVFWMNFTVPP